MVIAMKQRKSGSHHRHGLSSSRPRAHPRGISLPKSMISIWRCDPICKPSTQHPLRKISQIWKVILSLVKNLHPTLNCPTSNCSTCKNNLKVRTLHQAMMILALGEGPQESIASAFLRVIIAVFKHAASYSAFLLARSAGKIIYHFMLSRNDHNDNIKSHV